MTSIVVEDPTASINMADTHAKVLNIATEEDTIADQKILIVDEILGSLLQYECHCWSRRKEVHHSDCVRRRQQSC